MAFGMSSWDSQAKPYPTTGPPGIGYFRINRQGSRWGVECLLFRNDAGELVGILNYYPVGLLNFVRAGEVNVVVHPEWRRQGVARRLSLEAIRRWDVDPDEQRFTQSGKALHARLRQQGLV